MRADAGGDPARCIDRDGEIGAVRFAIFRHHPLQPKCSARSFEIGDANQSAAMRGHEIDRFRCRLLRRHHQIAFVLAIGIVGHDHHRPCAMSLKTSSMVSN